jgi:hypothetical protein
VGTQLTDAVDHTIGDAFAAAHSSCGPRISGRPGALRRPPLRSMAEGLCAPGAWRRPQRAGGQVAHDHAGRGVPAGRDIWPWPGVSIPN